MEHERQPELDSGDQPAPLEFGPIHWVEPTWAGGDDRVAGPTTTNGNGSGHNGNGSADTTLTDGWELYDGWDLPDEWDLEHQWDVADEWDPPDEWDPTDEVVGDAGSDPDVLLNHREMAVPVTLREAGRPRSARFIATIVAIVMFVLLAANVLLWQRIEDTRDPVPALRSELDQLRQCVVSLQHAIAVADGKSVQVTYC